MNQTRIISSRRFFSILIILMLILSLIPAMPASADVLDFEAAMASIEEGGTIDLKGQSYIIGTQTGKELDPYIFKKKVTITDSTGGGNLTVWKSGLLLEADVTFKDVKLTLANSNRNAVFANGYTLTMENVTGGSREINLFAGNAYAIQPDLTTKPFSENSGDYSKIVLRGENKNFGNIYGGSMNGNFDYDVELNLSGSFNGDVYACGAIQSTVDDSKWFDTTYQPDRPDISNYCFPVTGKVDIKLSNSSVTKIDGLADSTWNSKKYAIVEYQDNYEKSNLSMKNIGGLKVLSGGALKPASMNSGIPVSVAEGATLNLSTVAASGENSGIFSLGDFYGGGTVVLGKDQTLNIFGNVSGTTKLAIDSHLFPKDARDDGHVYISAPSSSDGAFHLLPSTNQIGKDFVRDSSGNWSVPSQTTETPATKTELTITGATIEPKTYDGTKTATVTGVTFKDSNAGVSLRKGTDYTAAAEFSDADAGGNKKVSVTVTLKGDKYTLAKNTYELTGQTIAKATPSVKPAYEKITADGNTLADAKLTKETASVEGTIGWVGDDGNPLDNSTAVVKDKKYKWRFTPNDAGNYNIAEGTVVLYTSGGSAGGGGGGGGAGGGGGGGAPAAPDEKPQTEPVRSGTSTTVDLSSNTMSKGGQTTTTLDKQTADKLIETASANKSQEIVISTVTKNQSAASSVKAAEVTLPAETLKAVSDKTDASVVIKTDVAQVKLDNKAAAAVALQAQTAADNNDEAVRIVVEKVREQSKEVHFELKIVTSGGKVISDFSGGNVTVTVDVPKSLSNKKLVCVYIDTKGHMHKVDGALNKDGTYSFTTGHFSTYAIMSEEEADAAIEAQKTAVKAVKLRLRSQLVKNKSGKKAISLTWTNPSSIRLDGVEIYRSLKKNSGYGKKPISTPKSGKYTNTSVKSGKKYYYKARGYVTIDGEKVYTQYSGKASRTVK